MCINDIDKLAAPIPPPHGRAVFDVMRESDGIISQIQCLPDFPGLPHHQ